MIPSNLTVITAINNHQVLESNILRSQLLQDEGVQFIRAEGFASASHAYNYGISKAKGDLMVFAHQDVYIPSSWRQLLLEAIALIEKKPQPWAVLGIIGVNGRDLVKGRCWSTGLGREVGVEVEEPEPTVSVDELVFVVRKSSGIRFDEDLPGWHLYGTDIVQEALKQGFGAYIIHAPVVHNSLPVVRLDAGFVECASYMAQKWAHCLPIQTCCIRLTHFGWPLLWIRLRQLFVSTDRDSFALLPDPVAKARELKYE